ncbi:hypothetical protein VNO80_10010 [Phaseolus coccineus]|uniref:Uncharacterized protein n=1 Tax=Phaseolus coccineus TaxID=3886 RepID=A0AAN9NDQ3_PHACN
MWQFLLTAGSTCFAAKRFFAQQTSQCSYGEQVPTVDDAHKSSHRQIRMTKVELRSVGEVRTVQCNRRRKWHLDLKKRRKTVNNISAKTAFLSFKRRKSINSNSPLLSPTKQAASVLFDSGVRWLEELSGECESSALREDLDSQVLDRDQVEAELEFELQKLPGDTPDTIFHEETRSKLYEVKVPNEGCSGADDSNFNSSQFHALSASQLNQKLCELQIEQRENQIAELESELYLARSKLQEKEAELQALKNCVTLLIKLPLSTVSGTSHGTKARNGTTNWGYNTLDSMSEQSVGDVKTLIV